jgi:predicted dehydrogenase
VADWGAHHVDVAHWFMNADGKIPLRTSATGAFLAVPDADPEQVQDTFSIAWQYDNFIMTFANSETRTRSRTGACSLSATADRCR